MIVIQHGIVAELDNFQSLTLLRKFRDRCRGDFGILNDDDRNTRMLQSSLKPSIRNGSAGDCKAVHVTGVQELGSKSVGVAAFVNVQTNLSFSEQRTDDGHVKHIQIVGQLKSVVDVSTMRNEPVSGPCSLVVTAYE